MNFCSSFLPRADEVFSPSFSYGITSAALSRAMFRPYASLAFIHLFQIFVHPHFQRRNEEAVLVLGHVFYVGLAHDKDFDAERVSFDLYLFQLHHLLSDKICFVRPCPLRCFQPRKAFVCHAASLLFDIFSRRYSKSFLFFMRTYSQE